MKKYLLALVCATLVFAVGCGNKNQVKCTGTQTEGGVTIKGEIVADLDANDKVTDATVVYDLGDSSMADQYCSLFKLMEDADKGVSVSCSGTKITVKGFAQVESDEEDDVILGASKEEFIKAMEEQKFTCK